MGSTLLTMRSTLLTMSEIGAEDFVHKIRHVRRVINPCDEYSVTKLVLQQLRAVVNGGAVGYEWVDVPTEDEEIVRAVER